MLGAVGHHGETWVLALHVEGAVDGELQRLLVTGEQGGDRDQIDSVGDGVGGAVGEENGGQFDAGAQVARGAGGYSRREAGSLARPPIPASGQP